MKIEHLWRISIIQMPNKLLKKSNFTVEVFLYDSDIFFRKQMENFHPWLQPQVLRIFMANQQGFQQPAQPFNLNNFNNFHNINNFLVNPIPNPGFNFLRRNFEGMNRENAIFVDSDSDDDVQELPNLPVIQQVEPPPPPLPRKIVSLDLFDVEVPVFPEEFSNALDEALTLEPTISLGKCSRFLSVAVHTKNKIDNLVNRIILAGRDNFTAPSISFRADLEKIVANFFPKIYISEIRKAIAQNGNDLLNIYLFMSPNIEIFKQMKNSRTRLRLVKINDIVVTMQVIKFANRLKEEHEKVNKQKRFEEAEKKHELIECQCCCCEKLFEDMVQCPEGHLFCKECLERSIETLIGEGRSDVKCLSHFGCNESIPMCELERAVNPKALQRLFITESQNAVAVVNLPGLVKCHKCGFEATMDGSGVFHCPECNHDTCPGCGEPAHPGMSCEAMKKIDKDRFVEEKMNEAVIRVCPRCHAQFMKEDGCNKMECPRCHTWICYWCRKEIPKEVGYNHFWRQQGLCPPDKCPLWVQNETLHHIEAEQARDV